MVIRTGMVSLLRCQAEDENQSEGVKVVLVSLLDANAPHTGPGIMTGSSYYIESIKPFATGCREA